MGDKNRLNKPNNRRSKRIAIIITAELLLLLALFAAWQIYNKYNQGKSSNDKNPDTEQDVTGSEDEADVVEEEEELTPEEVEAEKEQERLKKEEQERKDLIVQADKLTLSYDYDGAIELIKSYKGAEGGYDIYPTLTAAITGYEDAKSKLVLYGGSYTSITQFNHIFFHSLIADNSKAFDGEFTQAGYNMYMTTISEFEKMMQKMYEDGYVLISMHDMVEQVTLDDGTKAFREKPIMLPEGKKPFVLSQDDVNYYDYMKEDGFASRFVIDENGIATTEMVMDDGSRVTGPFDMVPIVDAFVEEHPDFSYRGAKGIIALTGYEGSLGYRTNDPTSPTYEQDKETVKIIAEQLKAQGWEFASHSWGHRNSQTITTQHFITDTTRWLEEVGTLIGPTDIYIFPYGVDFESTMGHYESEKFKFMKEKGFNFFCGVDKGPWMHIKDDYIRMTRRPLDGQAMLQFPERLVDLFDPAEVIDPERPARDW
jgi:peptidoglycan/xylan/chitin deacetylase (PgdA/CDA1 family)